MFEAFSTAVTYTFSSNARTVLGDIVKFGTDATDRLDLMAASFKAADTAARGFAGAAYSAANGIATFRYAARQFGLGIDSIEKGFNRVTGAAGRVDAAVSGAMANIDTEIGITAARVDSASTVMASGLADIATEARNAAAGIASVSVAGNRLKRYSGNVGAAGAAGVGAAGARSAGHGITPAGIAGLGALGFLIEGTKQGGDLQNSAMQTAIAQGRLGPNLDATLQNMQPTIDQAYRMSSLTGGSVNDMMTAVQNMATSGLTNQQITTLATPLAKTLDILHYGKSQLAWDGGSTLLAGLTHDFGVFDQSGLNSVFQTLARAEYASPHKMNELGTQIRQFAPQFAGFLPGTAAQNADYIVRTEAFADRMGMMQRSGTGLNMLATYLLDPKTKAQGRALYDLGVTTAPALGSTNRFYDYRNQKLNWDAMIKEIQARAHAMSQSQIESVAKSLLTDRHGFSSNANRYLEMYLRPNAPEVWKRLNTQMDHEPSLDTIQHQLMETLPHAFGRLETNVESLTTVFGQQASKLLTKPVGGMADIVGHVTDFFRGNKTATTVGLGALALGSIKGIGTLFELLGGVSIFAERFAHDAKTGLGIRGYMRMPHGGGGAGGGFGGALMRGGGAATGFVDGIFGMLKSALTLGGLRGLGGAFGEFTKDMSAVGQTFRLVGLRGLLAGNGVSFVAGSIAKVGLAAISGAGDLLLLFQGLDLLKKKAPDIGKALGDAAYWITSKGGPMLLDAFKKAMSGLGSFLTSDQFWPTVWSGLGSLNDKLQGLKPSNIGGAIAKSLVDEWVARDHKDHPEHVWNEQQGYGPNWGLHGRSTRVPAATGAAHPATHAAWSTHATTATHKVQAFASGKMITIAEVNVYPSPGDDLSALLDSIEKHADRDHVGTATPTMPHARTGTTPGTASGTIG